ncbi:aspartic peptidase domain-containing protein [Armillaria novae-zelandiae]|uniref:Aspartic peptidase domain-containing protein n=1 Tax=Armillaria novae-zelandiae TaxID=153914 RepID=A0AA39NSX7_9AGAR|nr:aspartic peptidase domain-containing protein [Armillaria novae-zelandiae]
MKSTTLYSLLLPGAISARVQRRDSNGSQYANKSQIVTVPVSISQDSKYTVNVIMSTGAEAQNFSFRLTTSTGYITVAGTGCGTCDGVRPYNRTASTTATDLPGWQNVALIGGSNAGGNIITESCGLMKNNGQDWTYSNQTIVVANTSYSMFSPGVSGIFGLGPNSRDGNFSATVFGGYLSTKPSGENFTYGMALSPNTGPSSDGGYLHLIQPDNSFFQGDITWKTMQTYNATNLNTDFYIELDSWTLTTGSGNISRTGSLITAIDPICEALIFPQQDAGSLYSSITGAYVAGYTNSTTYYTVPCNTQMKLTLTINNLAVTLDESKLVINQGGHCTGLIQMWSSAGATEYVLGSTFLSNVYVIMTLSNATSGMVGFAEKVSNTSSGLSTGAIVGIAVGSAVGAILLIVIGILLFRYIRKRRQARKASPSAGGYEEPILTDGGPGATSPLPGWVVTPFSQESTPASPRPISAYSHPSPSFYGQGTYAGANEPGVDRILSPPPSYPVDTPDSGGIMSVTERRSPMNRDEKKRQSHLTASSKNS